MAVNPPGQLPSAWLIGCHDPNGSAKVVAVEMGGVLNLGRADLAIKACYCFFRFEACPSSIHLRDEN
jgi:hypothetical protein